MYCLKLQKQPKDEHTDTILLVLIYTRILHIKSTDTDYIYTDYTF